MARACPLCHNGAQETPPSEPIIINYNPLKYGWDTLGVPVVVVGPGSQVAPPPRPAPLPPLGAFGCMACPPPPRLVALAPCRLVWL